MLKYRITEIVHNLINKFNTRNPFEICDYLGIKIHYHDLCGKLKGYYMKHNGVPNIILDINLPPEQRYIVCGHELGHHCLHSINMDTCSFAFSNDVHSETDANLFCAELLLTDQEIMERTTYDSCTIFKVAEELYVPYWFVECKLKMMNDKGIIHYIESDYIKSNSLAATVTEDHYRD